MLRLIRVYQHICFVLSGSFLKPTHAKCLHGWLNRHMHWVDWNMRNVVIKNIDQAAAQTLKTDWSQTIYLWRVKGLICSIPMLEAFQPFSSFATFVFFSCFSCCHCSSLSLFSIIFTSLPLSFHGRFFSVTPIFHVDLVGLCCVPVALTVVSCLMVLFCLLVFRLSRKSTYDFVPSVLCVMLMWVQKKVYTWLYSLLFFLGQWQELEWSNFFAWNNRFCNMYVRCVCFFC